MFRWRSPSVRSARCSVPGPTASRKSGLGEGLGQHLRSQVFLGGSSTPGPSSLFLITTFTSSAHQIILGFGRHYLNSTRSSGSLGAVPSSVPGRPVPAFRWSHFPAFVLALWPVARSRRFVWRSQDERTVCVAAPPTSQPGCFSVTAPPTSHAGVCRGQHCSFPPVCISLIVPIWSFDRCSFPEALCA